MIEKKCILGIFVLWAPANPYIFVDIVLMNRGQVFKQNLGLGLAHVQRGSSQPGEGLRCTMCVGGRMQEMVRCCLLSDYLNIDIFSVKEHVPEIILSRS